MAGRYHRGLAAWRVLCSLVVAVCAATAAQAGVFSITPVRMYLGPKDRALAVTIVNDGDTDLVLQAESFEWTQEPDGTDKLTPTEDLVLSPPIVKLKPRARQVVRLGMVAPRDASRQLTYRVVMREVPEAVAPTQGIGVQIALAMSLPVFVTPPVAKRQVSCELVRQGEQAVARCRNDGTAYAQVRELRVLRGGQMQARFEGGTYILPGASRAIELKSELPLPAGPAQLALRFDDGVEAILDVALP